MKEEAENLFQQEINSKNKDRHNLRSKTGSKGSSKSRKGVRTTYDYLSNKERKKLSSDVSVRNLFDLLLTKAEFEGYPKEKQKEILLHWREIYPNSKIMEALEIKSQGTFNKFMDQLQIPKKRVYKKREKPQPKKEDHQDVEVFAAVAPSKKETSISILDGLQLKYNGVYDSDQLERIFTKLQLIIQGEQEIKYQVSITLQEVK
jgi:hypothetical protein